MARPFDRFIVLAEMRTGSNFLEENLNAIPGITCHGEAFNPHFIGRKDRSEYLGVTLAQRDADPFALWSRIEETSPGIAGFRFFHDHDPRVLDRALADPRCAKIVLTRNPVESYVSLKIARETGQWKLGDARRRKAATVDFDAAEFEAHLAALQAFQLLILRTLQTSGQTAFYIAYEDVGDLAVINGLAAWLGVEGRLDAVADGIKKQNPEPLADKVTDPAAMEAALARVDRFDLSRTPNFEPRRGAALPGSMASPGAPLLFLPVRCGPEAQVAAWLAALAGPAQDGGQGGGGQGGGLLTGFTQKTLRQWMRAQHGWRTFTVVRHPLARAHAAFVDRILSGACGEVRAVLRRAYKLDLPPPERVMKAMDRDAYRETFLGFLRFLKGNVVGQTGVRIDAGWASQAAVIDGYAQVVPPDFILREDSLARGLAFLASEVGITAPPPPAAQPGVFAAPFALADIADAELEAAARDAYRRDYDRFGFQDWRPPAG
jgi:LPS sulfotransferase NodH